ncbi:hypothetical protein HF072_00520 [Bacillus sp. RO3]|nr:hypothetical protein [Bacillus sp. RO3]
MDFIVVNEFQDLEDDKKVYKVGEAYPKGDYKPSEERVKELSSEHPKYKRVFIEAKAQDLNELSDAELKKVKNDDMKAYLDKEGIEYKSDDTKDELIARILKKSDQE